MEKFSNRVMQIGWGLGAPFETLLPASCRNRCVGTKTELLLLQWKAFQKENRGGGARQEETEETR